ncbi:MAG: type II secretory ATPase GspE/PulE/Tfp pilus assembly ATPase PilB-like protein [Candidatus Saccharimonadales bacterium]|jgi:type II secretory ATPase GspE/PulE/Tfp pilus assembly ATPase PilB-like protein
MLKYKVTMAETARQDEELSTQRRARVLSLAYTDTSRIFDKVLYPELLTVQEIKDYKIIPLKSAGHNLDFGIMNTTSQRTMDNIRQRFMDQQISFSIISETGYREYLELYDPPKKVEYADIQISAELNNDLLADVSATLAQIKADDMLAYIVQQAFRLKSSDIHLESLLEGARIRLRVHGVLHTVAKLDADKYRQLVSALASAANISTSVDDDQTGHINRDYKLATGEVVNVNLRVETVPAVNGMDAVLRIFNFRSDMLRLDKLGLDESQEATIRDIISHPTGLVLIVGPTGSGKTTTLYSILNELNTDARKIITLEDPVEYHIEGITQIPVKSREGQSFSEKFKAVLRLDPDVIMVGEIRDTDTAKTALQAALTGHLVLSTYHASTAAAAMTRLLDAIGENPLYASAIRLIQAQRLVRRLDDKTKTPMPISPELQRHFQGVLEGVSQIIDTSQVQIDQMYQPGKSPENPFGYSGQFAIRELMTMTPDMRQLLMKPAHELSTEAIQAVAARDGMLTMHQDGILSVLKGETTYEEISRVIN